MRKPPLPSYIADVPQFNKSYTGIFIFSAIIILTSFALLIYFTHRKDENERI